MRFPCSLPPGGGKAIVIPVHANPQLGHLNIFVSNWGVGVEESDREKIFLPFYRANLVDRIRAKKGMGIGLFVARLFALSHGGNVTLVKSIPGFNDPLRMRSEGYNTTFEVRLSTSMSRGTYTYDISFNERKKIVR